MINKTLSPHYIYTPLFSPLSGLVCESYTLNIRIWKGYIGNKPTEPNYTITKENPTGATGNDKVNISRIINDFIDFLPLKDTATGLLISNNQVRVETSVTYKTTNQNDGLFPQLVNTKYFSYGYNYGIEGENGTTNINGLLFENIEYNVSRTSLVCLPIEVLTSDDFAFPTVNITSYPSKDIEYTIQASTDSDTSRIVNYIWVNVSELGSDDIIEIEYKGNLITLLVVDECRYVPTDIYFINKDGQQQSLTFFKAKTDALSVTKSSFESNRGQPIFGNHQTIDYNISATSSFKVNSGFVPEETNEVFKQLLLSNKAWIINNDRFVPITIASKNLTFKTRQKDRLINYEIDFNLAYNAINNL